MTPRKGSTPKAAKAAPAKAARAKAAPKAAASKAEPKALASIEIIGKPGGQTLPAPPPAEKRAAPSAAAPAAKVSKKEQKHFEERLLAERGRLVRELGYLEQNVLKQNQRDSSGDLSGYSFHMADLGTDAMEREKAFLFASAEGRALYDLDEALRRLYNGQYGTCESCNQPIARERLEVVPHARLCIRCKEREEKAGRR